VLIWCDILPSIINYLFLYHRSLYVAFEALIRRLSKK